MRLVFCIHSYNRAQKFWVFLEGRKLAASPQYCCGFDGGGWGGGQNASTGLTTPVTNDIILCAVFITLINNCKRRPSRGRHAKRGGVSPSSDRLIGPYLRNFSEKYTIW